MKKILVWTAILFGVIIYMKLSGMTPNDLAINSASQATDVTKQGKTFGMILPPAAQNQLRS